MLKRRLDRLRATGVLYFSVECDREYLGHGVGVMCWSTVAPHALAEAGREVAHHLEVPFAAAGTGRTTPILRRVKFLTCERPAPIR